MKKLFIMMFGLLFVASATFASPSAKGDMITMSKADSQVLFGDSSVNVVALGSDEMKATEGEWIRIAIWAVDRGYQTYKAWSHSSRFWYPISLGWGASDAY